MTAAKVFIFAPVDQATASYRKLESEGCELHGSDAAWNGPVEQREAEMARMAQGSHAMMGASSRNQPITRTIMAGSPDLRIIAKFTIGVDDIDVDAATELGILVCHAPTEANWGGVAEGTIAALLTMLKKLRQRDRHLKQDGAWRDQGLKGVYLGSRDDDDHIGLTIGLIGFGRIGGRVAALLRPWKMRMLATDPYVPASRFDEHGVSRVDLPTLLRESDVVSLHVTLTPETRGMIGAEQLALMKRGAILINTARGACVREAPLLAALEEERLGGAILDVFEHEPLAIDHPLRRLGDNVLLSPHMVAANLDGGLGPGVEWATESVLRALRGELPDHIYNREAIPLWQRRFGSRPLVTSGRPLIAGQEC